VVNAIRTVFQRFAETGSVRQVWLWFRATGLLSPLQDTRSLGRKVRWVVPTYHAIHGVLIHPCYAGAYTYGRTRFERYVDDQGNVRRRPRRLPRDEWAVLIRNHHPGFIDWETFEANRMRIDTNTRPRAHQVVEPANTLSVEQAGRAVREGAALLFRYLLHALALPSRSELIDRLLGLSELVDGGYTGLRPQDL